LVQKLGEGMCSKDMEIQALKLRFSIIERSQPPSALQYKEDARFW
jgi:hypothetical protein